MKKKRKQKKLYKRSTLKMLITFFVAFTFIAYQSQALTAFEAHVINVTARIQNECPLGSTIFGYKFSDANQNGIFDESESGLEGWSIVLKKGPLETQYDYNDSGAIDVEDWNILDDVVNNGLACPVGKMCDFNNDSVLDSNDLFDFEAYYVSLDRGNRTTNAEGLYDFGVQPQGSYIIYEVLQEGWSTTTPGRITLSSLECGENRVDFGNHEDGGGEEHPFCGNGILEEGEQCDDGNSGNFDGCTSQCIPETGICGLKYQDKDKDGTQDEGEDGIKDWNIHLYKPTQCEAGDEWADEVTLFSQGLRKDGSAVRVQRSDPSHALGVAENDTNEAHFVSLGFGDSSSTGVLILKFENIVLNGAGADLEIFEATNEPYPEERVDVFVSQDSEDWFFAGNVNKDGQIDISTENPGLSWIQYVKIVEVSNASIHSNDADGYDLDAVRALHCGGEWEEVGSTSTDENGQYCFEDLEEGLYRVEEEQVMNWMNSTPLSVDVFFENGSFERVDFGNFMTGKKMSNCYLSIEVPFAHPESCVVDGTSSDVNDEPSGNLSILNLTDNIFMSSPIIMPVLSDGILFKHDPLGLHLTDINGQPFEYSIVTPEDDEDFTYDSKKIIVWLPEIICQWLDAIDLPNSIHDNASDILENALGNSSIFNQEENAFGILSDEFSESTSSEEDPDEDVESAEETSDLNATQDELDQQLEEENTEDQTTESETVEATTEEDDGWELISVFDNLEIQEKFEDIADNLPSHSDNFPSSPTSPSKKEEIDFPHRSSFLQTIKKKV